MYKPYFGYCVDLFERDTDNNMGKRLLNENLGRFDFTLAFIFLLNVESSSLNHSHFSSDRFSNAQSLINRARDFINWIIWGQAGESSTFLTRSIDLAIILFKHGQFGAAEVNLLVLFVPHNGFFLFLSYCIVMFTENILYFN